MTLTLAIIINVVLDVALLSLLAFAMSRATKLTPHRVVTPLTDATPVRAARQPAVASEHRATARLEPAFD